MRTFTTTLNTAVGSVITKPGYLVEIGFSSVVRLSTRGTVTFNSYVWSSADIKLSAMSVDESANQSGSIVFGNSWDDYGAVVLGEGVADKTIKVWAFYEDAVDDAVQVFDGVGDEVSFDGNGRITVTLVTEGSRTQFWPRNRINAASGFNTLIRAGTKLTIGGQTYVLERK